MRVRKTPSELQNYLGCEEGFVTELCRFEGKKVRLEPFQAAFIRNKSRFRWVTKARQVGYSFVVALEALARAHLRQGHTTVFVSYNLDDAKEKILTARQVFEDMPRDSQKKLVVDSKTELAFESYGGGRVSRILSVPSKAPRGKKGDIVLDELAHYINDQQVYSGSTALILRSKAQLTGCSTPLGRRGVFWEIAEQELKSYPTHWRQIIPWWLCRFFCTDVERAAQEAPELTTEERVERFGTEGIKEQFRSLPLEDFQQEFECGFIDESYSYYPYELILPCTTDTLNLANDITDIPKPEGRLVGGFDVGRTRDKSELAIFEQRDNQYICRYLKGYHRVPFEQQEGELRRALELLPIARLSIDNTGIGMNLAENLSTDYPQVVPENSTNANKERWCTDFKILLQRTGVELPKDRNLVAQIHGIQRKVTTSGKVAYEAKRTKDGHGDRFWAIALACQKERNPPKQSTGIVRVRIIG